MKIRPTVELTMKGNVIKQNRQQSRPRKPTLKVVSVELLPMPGIEQRLSKVFELLLYRDSGGTRTTEDGRDSDERG